MSTSHTYEMDDDFADQPVSRDATPSGVSVIARQPDGTEVNITEGVMAMYDLVIGSMDWGSGFWTVEDALPVVHVAQTCGFPEWEAAQDYVNAQRQSAEQKAFLRNRYVPPPMGVPFGNYEHEHVFSTLGRCMYPQCKAVDNQGSPT